MDQLACVDLPEFPLQLLCRRHPEWKNYPVVVVDEDKPEGLILWANQKARRFRILPGYRYASGLSLCSDLRAGVAPAFEIQRATEEVAALLRGFTPRVDPCSGAPGVFWLDASGLGRLFSSLQAWGRQLQQALATIDLRSAVVCGATRFGTYALARERRKGVTVFESAAAEGNAVRNVLLERLDLEPKLRDALHRLGIVTLGEFLRLPPGGLRQRFGNEAFRLHRLAAGERWDPLRPMDAPDSFEESLDLDHGVESSEHLAFLIKRLLHPLLARLAQRKLALAKLFIEFRLEGIQNHEPRLDTIRPAEPTLDTATLVRLVHLRLESTPLKAAVIRLLVSAQEVPATFEQLQLWRERPKREPRAANEAFARIRAELGEEAILYAELRDGHLPEARFGWRLLQTAVQPTNVSKKPSPSRSRASPETEMPRPISGALIRRIRRVPRRLPISSRQTHDDGWLLLGVEHGPVREMKGPYVISGGWWHSEIHREYHFAETASGACLWVFYDRRRRRWFLHGKVE